MQHTHDKRRDKRVGRHRESGSHALRVRVKEQDYHRRETSSHLTVCSRLFQFGGELLLGISNHGCFRFWDGKAQFFRLLHSIFYALDSADFSDQRSRFQECQTFREYPLQRYLFPALRGELYTMNHEKGAHFCKSRWWFVLLCAISPRNVPSFLPHCSHLKWRAT